MTILYEKVGRRYKPVMTDDWQHQSRMFDMVRPGAMLVVTNGNCASHIHKVNPDYAAVLAALKIARDACADAMHKAAEFKPRTTQLSKRHAKAYAAYMKAIPQSEREGLWAGSIADGLDAMEKALLSQIEMTMPYRELPE
jgi:hypothetical protein